MDDSFGFAAAEVVLTIAIVGILGLAAVVMSPSINPARLDAAAKQVQSDIELARQNAMTTGTTSGVAFILGGAYTVYQSTIATPLTSPLTKQDLIVTLSNSFSGVTISVPFVVEFNSFGAPTLGGGGSVTLASSGQTKVISVNATTGRVTIQ